MKISRNNPCPCGSGKKYKKCCYLKPKTPSSQTIPPEILRKIQETQDQENERRRQYGEVRPIIHADFKGHKFVAVGSELHYGKNWKSFPGFLLYYIKTRLGSDWGNAELKKPLEQRHQIMQWYDAMCRFQQKQKPNSEGIYEAVPNGAFSAYILLAYDLYVLRDNQVLQDDIIRRLKIPDQFQGARHELFATATCRRAGFSIEFEDEKDRSKKHPEFIATHKQTGQKIAVEAKSKHRKGILGYPGIREANNEIKLDVTSLINKAIKKGADIPLVIFVDTNLPPSNAKQVYKGQQPSKEFQRILDKMQASKDGKDLFNLIVFTNHPHHYGRDDEDDPQRHTTSVFSSKPAIIPTRYQCIIDLHDAARQHGNVPNEFPLDFNN
ncbi:MAG: SEC-C metal-binding domain-containing protein [Candidatus Brocadiales bacterium]|nr:SEC-C metal-binding domain-containing protein [Candidatus Bathyanammoxibius amoris]